MSGKAEVFQSASEVAGLPGDSILSRALFQNDAVKVVLFHFARGQELSEHTASMPAMLRQVRGRARWVLGGETIEAQPGQWAWMPAGLPHSIHADEEAVLELVLLKAARNAA